MTSITYQAVGLEYDVFKVAVDKLQNEGLITGASIISGGNITIPKKVLIAYTKMTKNGIEYVEQKLGIENNLTGMEKVKKLADSSAKWGWEQLKDLTAKVLGEIASKAIGG